jgi:isopentenyl diphosphate isomerase/L-lactate dehydrogenase-like FMN-dependent dehydrogenase
VSIESRWAKGVTRRQAVRQLIALLAGSPLLYAQQYDPRPLSAHKRVPGMDEMVTAFDFEPICFSNMLLRDYDYMAHGTDSEFTLRRNREAFGWVDLIQKPGTPPASLDTTTQLFGMKMDYPIMIAPTASQLALHPDAEAGMYKGATAGRTPMIVSNVSSLPIEKIAEAANGPKWCQFYPVQDVDRSRITIERFLTAGAGAIVVTVDQQATRFERDLHDRNLGGNPRSASNALPAPRPTKGPGLYRASPARLWYSWKYLDDIRPFVKGPMLVKGILTAEDAKLCVEHGFDGIVVSNHGGRSLDYGPATLEVLPEIVDAVGGKIPVLVDSGFRRGSDIVKAIALGANAVCLGRASRWALGAFGAAGVQRLLEIMKAEFREAMASTGRTSIAALDRTAVRTNFS